MFMLHVLGSTGVLLTLSPDFLKKFGRYVETHKFSGKYSIQISKEDFRRTAVRKMIRRILLSSDIIFSGGQWGEIPIINSTIKNN